MLIAIVVPNYVGEGVYMMKPKHFKKFVVSFGRAQFFSLTTLSFLFCHPDLCLNILELK